jgi:hypothetical protein
VGSGVLYGKIMTGRIKYFLIFVVICQAATASVDDDDEILRVAR